MAEVTPVTVLTGFPGAGKTTLLNHLLQQPHLARTVVVANAFGGIGGDRKLARKFDADAMLPAAGCPCCSVRGDLARALRERLPRARRDEIGRVMIDTTGLADPVPILVTLLRDPVVASAYRLDGVIAVVDAVNGRATLDAQPEAVRQVALADRIVLSKTDLADGIDLRACLHRLNPHAPVIAVPHGVADPHLLLHGGPFKLAGGASGACAWPDADGGPEAEHAHDPNRHDARIRTFCFSFDRPLLWTKLERRLERLISAHGEKLLRMKGLLDIAGQDQPSVLQGVRHLLHPPAMLPRWPDGDPRGSRLVFVVHDLPRSVIANALRGLDTAEGAV